MLEIILIVNIILKFFNLIDWSWSAALWPLWAELIIIAIFWLSGHLEDLKD